MKTEHIVFYALTIVGLYIGYLSRNGFDRNRYSYLDTDLRVKRIGQILHSLGIFSIYESCLAAVYLGANFF